MEPGTAARNLGSYDRPVPNSGLLAEQTTDLTPPCLGFIPSPPQSTSAEPRSLRLTLLARTEAREKLQGSSTPRPMPALRPAGKSQLSESPVALNLE